VAEVCWRGNYVKVSGSVLLLPTAFSSLVWGVLWEFPQLFRRRRRELNLFLLSVGRWESGWFSVFPLIFLLWQLVARPALPFNEINYDEED